jgi:PhnB protein
MSNHFPPPEGHHSITPAFVVPGARAVIDWLQAAFGASIVDLYDGPNGTVAHAEIMIDGSVVMCGEPMPGMDAMPGMFSYYVRDGEAVDAIYRRALETGASSEREPADQFYGYRSATVRDVGGNRWTICAVIEQLTAEQMHERMANMSGQE